MDFLSYIESQAKTLGNLNVNNLYLFKDELIKFKMTNKILWILGNGGSASTASHAVVDFVKTADLNGNGSIRSHSISEMVSLTSAYSNDEAFEVSLANSLDKMSMENDAVLILSVSGTSPNLLNAFKIAKKKNLLTFAIVGTKGEELAKKSDNAIVIPSTDYQIVENIQLILIHWLTKSMQASK